MAYYRSFLLSHIHIPFIARGKTIPTSTGDKLEGGPMTDLVQQSDESIQVKREKEREKKAAKRMKKDLSAVESQAPLGPLVALGKPRDKLSKRPRCDSMSGCGLSGCGFILYYYFTYIIYSIVLLWQQYNYKWETSHSKSIIKCKCT